HEPDTSRGRRVRWLRRPEHSLRGLARGIAEDPTAERVEVEHHPVDDRLGVTPEADRGDQGQAAGPPGICRGHFARDHCAERVTDERRVLESQRLQQLVVAEDEIPESVEVIDVVRRGGRRAGMLGSDHAEALGQLLEERVPGETPWAVKEHERGPASFRQHPDADAALPDGVRFLSNHAGRAPTGATPRGRADSRSRSGHQWLTQPSSSQTPRRWGRTSRAKRSMFSRASSCGIEPICRSTMRLPTRRPSITSSFNRSRTVAGLPAMTYPRSTKSRYRSVLGFSARRTGLLIVATRLR